MEKIDWSKAPEGLRIIGLAIAVFMKKLVILTLCLASKTMAL